MIRTLALSTSFSECSVGFASTAQFGIGTVLNEFSSNDLGCNDNALLIGATFLEVEGSESVGRAGSCSNFVFFAFGGVISSSLSSL